MKKPNRLIDRLFIKYKLIVLNAETFQERAYIFVSLIDILILMFISVAVIVSITIALFFSTSLKQYIPGYADVSLKADLSKASEKIDSLERIMNSQDVYLKNIKDIINGEAGSREAKSTKRIMKKEEVHFGKNPKEDSLLRKRIESEYKNENIARNENKKSKYNFTNPAKGTIISTFSLKNNKLNTLIATEKNTSVKAVLEGIITLAENNENGTKTIVIQHNNDIISIYKNCTSSKEAGNTVYSGEIIGTSSKTNMNKYEFIFELWIKGRSVDPAEYLKFS